jgi:hypothetical protein
MIARSTKLQVVMQTPAKLIGVYDEHKISKLLKGKIFLIGKKKKSSSPTTTISFFN